MSYNNVSMNNINTYNNINNKTNKISTSNSMVANGTQGITSGNMLEALGLGNLGLDSMLGTENGQGTEGLAQMLQMGMLSKVFGGGEDSSGSEGFQMVLGALVKALNDKQQGNKIGIDSNNQFDGVHINDLVLRTLNNTALNAVNTNKT